MPCLSADPIVVDHRSFWRMTKALRPPAAGGWSPPPPNGAASRRRPARCETSRLSRGHEPLRRGGQRRHDGRAGGPRRLHGHGGDLGVRQSADAPGLHQPHQHSPRRGFSPTACSASTRSCPSHARTCRCLRRAHGPASRCALRHGAWSALATGAPAAGRRARWRFDCRLVDVKDVATHHVLFGEVVAVRMGPQARASSMSTAPTGPSERAEPHPAER